MKKDGNWMIQIQNFINKRVISIYEDGRVYGTGKGNKLCTVSSKAIDEIKRLINKDIYAIKSGIYPSYKHSNFNVKFWDNSRKKRELYVKGWEPAIDVLKIIFNNGNIVNIYVEDLISEMEKFYEFILVREDDTNK